jgi:hypothetical protein
LRPFSSRTDPLKAQAMTDPSINRDGIAFDHSDADRGAGVEFSELQRQYGACGCRFAADNPKLVLVSVLHDDVAQYAQLTTRSPPDTESRMTSSTKHRHLNASVFLTHRRTQQR